MTRQEEMVALAEKYADAHNELARAMNELSVVEQRVSRLRLAVEVVKGDLGEFVGPNITSRAANLPGRTVVVRYINDERRDVELYVDGEAVQ